MKTFLCYRVSVDRLTRSRLARSDPHKPGFLTLFEGFKQVFSLPEIIHTILIRIADNGLEMPESYQFR
ncbi:hypothetical protein [Microcoleus vaginatus]|uniref:hypothetical protein n=1 Tax=Microcoleus vaginatus TaxID=119532 RepID=UPI00110F855F